MPAHSEIWRQTRGMSRGEPAAIEWFYRRYFDQMFAEARRAGGGDENRCLDIVQEATLKALRCMRPFREETQLTRWVYVLVRSVVYDELRRESRRLRRENRRAQADAWEPTEEEGLDARARLAWLEKQLAHLTREEARLLDWRYRLGWTLARMGSQLGLTAGAVDGRLRRLVAKIKRQAESDFDDGETYFERRGTSPS